MAFTVDNPKPSPSAVTGVGYEIRMNGVDVGEGASSRAYAIPGGGERTITTTTVLRNERLDDWLVSHLDPDQVTNLTVDTSVVVDPDAAGVLGKTVPAFRLDSDELDDETDIFGTTDSDGLDVDASGGDDADETQTPGELPTPTPTSGGTAIPPSTPAPTDAPTASPSPTSTSTPTDDGILF